MKITHNKVGQNLNLSDTVKNDKSNSAGKADKTSSVAGKQDLRDLGSLEKSDDAKSAARVDVSERAKQAKKIKEIAMATPDVDVDKVAKYKKMIDEGTYKVDAKAVADRMVDEQLGMMTASNADE